MHTHSRQTLPHSHALQMHFFPKEVLMETKVV